jgi:Domain of unknown function (DUF4184)
LGKRYTFGFSIKFVPLTFSHPAIILPAKYLPERSVSMTGLIVGSITPDFEYFVRLREVSTYTHTWLGMFYLDLPFGLLLTFIYHYIVRDLFICNIPGFFRKRFSPYTNFNWGKYFKKHFLIVIICLLIGIASHLFWDSFTHLDGYFVRIIPVLRENTYILGVWMPFARVLQTISTIVGAAIILFAIMRMPIVVKYAAPNEALNYWFIILGMGVVMICIRMVWYIYDFDMEGTAIPLLSGMVAGSMIAPFFIPRKNDSFR